MLVFWTLEEGLRQTYLSLRPPASWLSGTSHTCRFQPHRYSASKPMAAKAAAGTCAWSVHVFGARDSRPYICCYDEDIIEAESVGYSGPGVDADRQHYGDDAEKERKDDQVCRPSGLGVDVVWRWPRRYDCCWGVRHDVELLGGTSPVQPPSCRGPRCLIICWSS